MANRLERWVDEVARLTTPDSVYWCTGSDDEIARLTEECIATGVLHRLNQDAYPNCYLHRSDPQDVARTEHLTFICSQNQDDAGPTNNWLAPAEAKARLTPLYKGAMKGRTLYVVPYILGPVGSPFSKVGVEITDSRYVVLNLNIMTRMGQVALDQLGDSDEFVPGLHSLGDLSPERRFICHFPEERLIWSVGSGYGGNALLSKKCFALRIASTMARDEGWLAEHMLILEVEHPDGHKSYVAGALPSACGKTNLAMLVSPLEHLGYKVRTVGDDIAWLRIGPDGRLWAINPEAGFFGVVPGTGPDTNPNALGSIGSNSIYTNVAVDDHGHPWWEGCGREAPSSLLNWQGQPWDGSAPAAHPNSRFTAPARQCPSISPEWENPQGVPIDIMLFGGRRARLTPLIYEPFDWAHGVFVAATIGSETTAAQTGRVGVVRRDPMAMLPFCGYNMSDYLSHWLEMGKRIPKPPRIFHVNWFRKGEDGRWLWPGFGQNLRPLLWALERARGTAGAQETPIGYLPRQSDLNLDGLEIDAADLDELLQVRDGEWTGEADEVGKFFETLGPRLPDEMHRQLSGLKGRLNA
ncbi:phosphoenolpyruvate carboxykinase (GTP) [Candidatus Poribacteria bacterium]|nr:phosphoenolpyruvate carboxykinase (GTP) [Candidatus Poribacteria bacterium]